MCLPADPQPLPLMGDEHGSAPLRGPSSDAQVMVKGLSSTLSAVLLSLTCEKEQP